MKESVLNVFVFLLVFTAALVVELAFSALFLFIVPGGQGSFFARPTAGALYPALVVGLLISAARVAHKPGRFWVSYTGVLLAGFLLMTISFPLIQNQKVLSTAVLPESQGEFWILDHQEKLYLPEQEQPRQQFVQNAVLIPAKGPMQVVPQIQYDPWNKRFLLPGGVARGWALDTPSQRLFSFPGALRHLEADFYTIYFTLHRAWNRDLVFFGVLSLLFVALFLGLQTLFAYKTWPLVVWLLTLALARLFLVFVVFCLSGVPNILEPWLPAVSSSLRDWLGLAVLALGVLFLFFLNLVVKRDQRGKILHA
ncbi:MAG: hypothetical protein HKM06_09525 [Spirochaetales bacterium]|nr:hypothetical protein [Spirochaetales bacterium]